MKKSHIWMLPGLIFESASLLLLASISFKLFLAGTCLFLGMFCFFYSTDFEHLEKFKHKEV